MKKITQFTLNVPKKENNFKELPNSNYFIDIPGNILELRIFAPAGSKFKLGSQTSINDSSTFLIGATEIYYLNLTEYYTPISKVYFDFNMPEKLKPVIVDVTYTSGVETSLNNTKI